MFVTLLVFSVLIMIGALWLGWKMKEIADGFYIKQEIKFQSVWAVLGFVAAIILRPFVHVHVLGAIFWIMSNAMIFHSLDSPIIESRRMEKTKYIALSQPSSLPKDSISQSLAQCLQNPKGLELFTEHLVKEFSVENILFYCAVQKFSEKCAQQSWESSQSKNYSAGIIYADFIADDSYSEWQVGFCMYIVLLILPK